MCVPGPVAACKGIQEYPILRSFNRPHWAVALLMVKRISWKWRYLVSTNLATGFYNQVHLGALKSSILLFAPKAVTDFSGSAGLT